MDTRLITFTRINDINIPSVAAGMFSVWQPDERSSLPYWNNLHSQEPERFLRIIEETSTSFTIEGGTHTKPKTVDLLNSHDISELFSNFSILYLDISGMSHHVWAPILSASRKSDMTVIAIYTEPSDYLYHSSPTPASPFDLTSRFGGLAPLPGLANLVGPNDYSKTIFIPFLGFEGSRARQLLIQLDPSPPIILPVIGVPGFNLEFPTHTVASNRDFLDETSSFSNIRLARAHDPFDSIRILEQIRSEYPDYHMYVAPVGTKPHALGAILYYLDNSEKMEIMYDHPIRKIGARKGVGPTHVYLVQEASAYVAT